jgi:hypothetical protein
MDKRTSNEKGQNRIRDLNLLAEDLHVRVAELNEKFKSKKKRKGPTRTFMLIEINGCASLNTGGGATAAAEAHRNKKKLTITAESLKYAHIYSGDVHNLISTQEEKISFSGRHCTHVVNESMADVKKRAEDKVAVLLAPFLRLGQVVPLHRR